VVIIGDIGGTNARLALVGLNGRVVKYHAFASRQFPSLEEALQQFLDMIGPKVKLTAAALGVAGPVVNGRCVATNLPWVVDSRAVARKLKVKRVTLLNDLVALSLGALGVPRSKLHSLASVANGSGFPVKKGANIAVIAAGTGLGEAILVWNASLGRYLPNATEGGHADFAPQDDVQIELLQFLRGRFGHVSWERVLSGNGLGNIYDFLVQRNKVTESVANAELLAASADRNAQISQLGLKGKSEAALQALELFATIYGAEAGNLALKSLALGGVYVCGNITAHMLPVLERAGFAEAFRAKGRFASFMEKIPVAAVLDNDVGLGGGKAVALGKLLP
jgi:glucokinase